VAFIAVLGLLLLNYIETAAGLPNTCSQCGERPGSRWYAENVDQARSGLGLCARCAGQEQAADDGDQAAVDTQNATTTRGNAAQQPDGNQSSRIESAAALDAGPRNMGAKPSGKK
jgi:hypothetical protein